MFLLIHLERDSCSLHLVKVVTTGTGVVTLMYLDLSSSDKVHVHVRDSQKSGLEGLTCRPF